MRYGKTAEYQREWRRRNPGFTAGAIRRYTARHPEVIAAWRSRQPPEYWVWKGMKKRCVPGNVDNTIYYQGVTVCERWRKSFAAFLADMGPRPSPEHSIDRWPDNDGNYEPGNCRWATPMEQTHNRRKAA
jgi:hypothetical protein